MSPVQRLRDMHRHLHPPTCTACCQGNTMCSVQCKPHAHTPLLSKQTYSTLAASRDDTAHLYSIEKVQTNTDRSIGDYTLPDLHRQYKKYLHKRPKHILLWPSTLLLQCFSFASVFSLPHLPTPSEVTTWPLAQWVFLHVSWLERNYFCTFRFCCVCI
jgi:hypothetical protein